MTPLTGWKDLLCRAASPSLHSSHTLAAVQAKVAANVAIAASYRKASEAVAILRRGTSGKLANFADERERSRASSLHVWRRARGAVPPL